MIKRIKNFIKELQFKRFEREINKAIALGKKKFKIDGLEFEFKERND